MFKSFTGYAKAALCCMTLLAATAASADSLRPSSVKIKSLTFAGSGCPAGSLYGQMGRDYNAFQLNFDSFVAESGPGIPLTASRKNCAISATLEFPAGWSYSIGSVQYKGYVNLDAGVSANQTSSYYFQGSSATARLTTNVYGPLDASYTIKDELGISAMVWSPCGATRAVVMNAAVRTSSNSRFGYGLITLDQIEGKVEHTYGLQWRKCR